MTIKGLKRFWPVTYLMAALIALMGLMTFFSKVISDKEKLVSVNFILTLFALLAVIILSDQLRRDVKDFLVSITRQLEPEQEFTLSGIPIPCAVIGYKGELVWYNELFEESLLGGIASVGRDIRKVNRDFDIEKMRAGGSFNVRWGDRWMDCHVTECKNSSGRYIVYFSDISELKYTEQRYLCSRPTVMLIVFDNEDELLKVRESERMRVLSAVDALINKWAGSVAGICWADARDKSLIVLEETEAKKLIDSRFSILEEAHSIVVEDGTPVTLSIGVGRGGASIEQCEEWALQALDMALGRGGDQAVLRSGEGYSFFGGVSASSERQSRVRIRMLGAALNELILKSDNCIVMGHKFSDLDAMGAAIGVYAIAKTLGKEAFVVADRETTLAGSLINYYSRSAGNAKCFLSPSDALDHIREGTLLVIVDTHSPDFLESRVLYEKAKNVVVIDHHRLMVGHIENSKLLIHEPYASSACEIVSELAAYNSEKAIGRLEAEALLAGIMLDTKNYVLRTGVRTFEASAFLRRRGADTVEVRKLFAESLETYVEKLKLVSQATVYNGCAISCAPREVKNMRIICSQAADDMLAISGVNASFVLFPQNGGISISARSLGKVNVQLIMEKLGGGGHLTMAGALLDGKTMEQAIELLHAAIDK